VLEVQHLYRSFRTIPAVIDVSFKVAGGEIVGFLGPNGAGKSTTVRMITGMLRPDDGKVLFEGRNIRDDMERYRAVLGYVPEEAHLYTYLSGLEYLQLIGRLRGMNEASNPHAPPGGRAALTQLELAMKKLSVSPAATWID